MELNEQQKQLISIIADGLPLIARPFAEIGRQVGMDEDAVIRVLSGLVDSGVIKRFGLIVRHHELGYRANAMTVWDIPDDKVDEIGRSLGEADCVTLCYRRPRRLPDWPYNLFCMVHGRERETVLEQVEQLALSLGLQDAPRDVLFSGQRFKQRGAHYNATPDALERSA